MLYSDKYLLVQKAMHKSAGYGNSADKNVDLVLACGYQDILDYGCGKRGLERALGFDIHNYDPAIDSLKHNNMPHELVYCGDVLEHIEPDCLEDVLADIKRCSIKATLLVICTRPAKKSLPDGRNAHLIVQNADWWRTRIRRHFTITNEMITPQEYTVWA